MVGNLLLFPDRQDLTEQNLEFKDEERIDASDGETWRVTIVNNIPNQKYCSRETKKKVKLLKKHFP